MGLALVLKGDDVPGERTRKLELVQTLLPILADSEVCAPVALMLEQKM